MFIFGVIHSAAGKLAAIGYVASARLETSSPFIWRRPPSARISRVPRESSADRIELISCSIL